MAADETPDRPAAVADQAGEDARCPVCHHRLTWHRSTRCLGDLMACECAAVPLLAELAEANRKVEALLLGDKALSSRIWLAEEVGRLKAELTAERAKVDGGEWQWGWAWPGTTPDWTHSEAVARQAAAARRPPADVVRRWIGPTEAVGDGSGT